MAEGVDPVTGLRLRASSFALDHGGNQIGLEPSSGHDAGQRVSPRVVLLRRIGVRLALSIPVLLGVVTLIFLMGVLSNQDPARSVLGVTAGAAQRYAFDKAHGFYDPLPIRWLEYLGQIAHGDFGVTIATQESIGGLLIQAVPVTASLTILASLLALVMGLALGAVAAVKRSSPIDKAVLLFSSVGHSLPSFWVGLLAIEAFAVHYNWIPSGGYVPPTQGVLNWLHALIAPALVLAIPFGAVMARVVRSSMVEELAKEYVRTAQGLGLSMPTIVVRNVLRNAMVAPLTTFGVAVGGLFSGAVLIESLFNLPGLGSLMVTGIHDGDFGIVRAVGMFGAVAFVVVNVVVDVLTTILNPRERTLRL